MIKRKICVVITARPSYSRVKTALKAIKNHENLELQIVLNSSALIDKYGNAEEVITQDGFTINERIYNLLSGNSKTIMAKTTGLAIIELASTFARLKPDIVVTIADRYETIAASIAASYQNIPLAHLQGGEVTGNIDEKVRHANTKLADLHLVSTQNAKDRVIKMGENQDSVFITGCPSIDIAKEVIENSTFDLKTIKNYSHVGYDIDIKNRYLVVLQHPVTNEYSDSQRQITETLEAIKYLDIPTIWLWPNSDFGTENTSKEIRKFREANSDVKIQFFKNFRPDDFLHILKNSLCLIGNSSVGIRECSYLGVPVVNIGSRQNKRERGRNVMDCDPVKEEIISRVQQQIKKGHYPSDRIFGKGDSGQKIASILARWELKSHKTITI